MNAPFDTLALVDALKATPLGKDGAETVARAMADVAMSNVATKHDLEALKHSLTVRIVGSLGGLIALGFTALGVVISLQ